MKIFLSWSGEASHAFALALRDWLPSVLPYVQPWVSSEDIPKGRRWGREIDSELEATTFCIVCLVPGNAASPWINFEAGAVAKVVADSRVVPLLLGGEVVDLNGLPLAMFQAATFRKDEVFRVLKSINSAAAQPISAERLTKNFEFCWGGIEGAVATIDLEYSREESSNWLTPEHPLLTQPERQITAYVALHSDHYPTVGQLAMAVRENEVKTRYHLDRLEKLDFVHALYSAGGPVRFMITEAGRKYVVEQELLE